MPSHYGGNGMSKGRSMKKNSPKIVRESRREIYAPTNEYDRKGRLKLDERGAPLVKKIGEKIVKVKRSKFTYAIPKSKKFKYKPFKELILNIAGQPMKEQKNILDKTFEEWKGELDQIDDVCMVGLQI